MVVQFANRLFQMVTKAIFGLCRIQFVELLCQMGILKCVRTPFLNTFLPIVPITQKYVCIFPFGHPTCRPSISGP